MNLDTISSPGGEATASSACSLSSLLGLGCRSRAEAAQSFAKKLQTKLWSLSPSASSDGLSSSCAMEEGDEEDAEQTSWGVAVEARFDLDSRRVETVVTSTPRTFTSTFHCQPLLTHHQLPVSSETSPSPSEDGYVTATESSSGVAMDRPSSNGWTDYRPTPVAAVLDHESDASSSDQYFDFGLETPLDSDSAGEEETVSHEPAMIVINRDDGLPVQSQDESGCLFSSSDDSEDSSEDSADGEEEEPSFYESASSQQSPAIPAAGGAVFAQKPSEQKRFVTCEQTTVERAADSNSSAFVRDAASAPAHDSPRAVRARENGATFQGELKGTDDGAGSLSTGAPNESARPEIIPFSPASDRPAARPPPSLIDTEDVVGEVIHHHQQHNPSSNSDMVRLEPVTVDHARSDPTTRLNGHHVAVEHESAVATPEHQQHHNEQYTLGELRDIVAQFTQIKTEHELDLKSQQQQLVVVNGTQEPETRQDGAASDVEETASIDKESTTTAAEDDEDVVGVDEEEEECDTQSRPRVQRSTSLKSGKTPPGTPGRKKIVRFADALGLDLALVRTFLDEVPNVPQSAFSDLCDALDAEEAGHLLQPSSNDVRQQQQQHGTYIRISRRDPATNSTVTTFVDSPRILVASFTQPGNLPDFLERVKQQRVCLETASMMDETRLRGVVRVLNVDFHKSVLVRYTVDEWRTSADQLATYVPGSCDGLSDRFGFSLVGIQSLQPGQRLLFALCYRVAGQEVWDNNQGRNYIFQCISNTNYMPSIALHSPTVSDAFLPYM